MPSYSQYKRQLAVLDADDTDIEAWITVKGNHIPIKKGQSKEDAVKSFIESKNGGGKPKSNKSTFYKNVSGKQFGTPSGRTIIENELLTEKEMQKYGADPTSEKFEKKDLGKKDHHYFFGARFETPKNKMSKPSDSDMSGGSINNIFQQANAGLQSFVDDTGYQPQTTFWSDFGIAEPFGEKAVEDTYNRAFREWKNDKVYLTELSMMLNWKLWQHYDKGNEKMARLYDKLWKQTDKYAHTHLKGDDLQYYIRTTD